MARTLSGLPLRRTAAWSALLDRVAGLPLHPAALNGGMGYLLVAALNAAALTRTKQLGLAPWQPPEMTRRSGGGRRRRPRASVAHEGSVGCVLAIHLRVLLRSRTL
jgi:hypothetical protein